MISLLNEKKNRKARVPRILKAVLDRVPVLVVGRHNESIISVVNQVTELVPFRRELVFYHHFLDQTELQNLYSLEEFDAQSERVVVQSHPETIDKVLEIQTFKGWVVGCPAARWREALECLLARHDPVVVIHLLNDGTSLKTQVEGTRASVLKNTKFEKEVLQKCDAESAFALIEGLLDSKINYQGGTGPAGASSDLRDLMREIARMNEEVQVTEKKLLEKELLGFHVIAFLSFTILSKIESLQQLGVQNLKINEKTLKKTLMYSNAPVDRIHEFIAAEWGSDFSELTVSGWGSWLGDALEGVTGRTRA